MPARLTPAQVEAFRRDGFCFPVDVMSGAQARRYRRRFEEAESRYPEAFNPASRNNAHLVLTCLDEIVHHEVILDAVEDLIGPDIVLWGTVLFVKEPGDPAFVSWHQDATYMGLEPHDFVTAWVALSPATVRSGCMRMVPGSHRAGIQAHRDTFGEHNILTRGQTVDGVAEGEAMDVVLEPGQMSLHHARTLHGSGPNLSDDRRIGLSIQSYLPPTVRQTKGVKDAQRDRAMLARGVDRQGHFECIGRPRADMEPEAIALRESINRRWSDMLYEGAATRRSY